jgi:hypothetical protein
MQDKGAKTRKIRNDKKKPIAPYILDEHRTWIYRIARKKEICEGDIGLQLIQRALENEDCIAFFSLYFKRDYLFNQYQLFIGHNNAQNISEYLNSIGSRSRFKIKANKTLSDQLFEFQIALGCPYLAHATLALLQYALIHHDIVQQVVPGIELSEITSPSSMRSFQLSKNTNVWSVLK